MRAVVYAGPGRVEVDDVPVPEVSEPGDAVVKVSRTAICGSDLHLLDGKTPGMREGAVIGHEFVGAVTAAGGAAGVDEGRQVLGSFLIACGSCLHCRLGRFNFCERRRALGLGTLAGDLDGAQAEYVRVPNARLNLKILPDGDDAAAERVLFAGDILATGFYAASLADVRRGETAVVVGAGPVGLFCALACRAGGATVIVLDTDENRREFARTTYGLDAVGDQDAAREVLGRLADVAIDAVGAVPALKTAMRCARDGGRVVVVGVYGAERYDMPIGMSWVRGLQIRFTGMANVQAHWDTALAEVGRGSFDPSAIITHRLPLDEAPKGYELFAAREAMKVVMAP